MVVYYLSWSHRLIEMRTESESRLRKLCRSIHEVGLLYTTQLVAKRIFPERVLRADTVFILENDIRNWPRDQAPAPGMRWANEKDGNLFAKSNITKVELLNFLARGAQIAICERDGVLVGFFIYETGNIDYFPWRRYRLTPDVVWITMTWTAPQYRGKGINAQIRHFGVSELSRQGYVRTLGAIDAQNISSLRATIKKTTIVGSVSSIRSFGLTAVWVNGRMEIGRWHNGMRFELDSDLFHVVPNRPYGPVDAKHFERLIGKMI